MFSVPTDAETSCLEDKTQREKFLSLLSTLHVSNQFLFKLLLCKGTLLTQNTQSDGKFEGHSILVQACNFY